MAGKRSENKEKTKKSKIGKVLLIITLIIVILLGVVSGIGFWYVSDKLGKLNYQEIDEDSIAVTQGVEQQLKGYRTIAIFGVDSRGNELVKGTRSDSIILATIDEKNKEVKLTSVYRDTYLELTGRDLDKVTHAYAYGGAEMAMSTLNTNLDLNIKEFVTVNFDSVVEIVNAIGGVQMKITDEEVKYINNYIDETSKVTGISSKHITKAGTYTLDGVQAVAYGRIRYTAGGDYKRTERMRDIIMAAFNKIKTLGLGQLNKLADTLLPKVYTNINSMEILSLMPQVATYKIVDSTGWPYDTKGKTINGVWYGPPITLESNVKELHEKVYGQTDYEPSNTVKTISDKIIKKTGYDK